MAKHHHHQPPDPSRYRHAIAGVIAITSVYIYFLIFAEFAFIESLHKVVLDAGVIPLMATLGLSGIGGSLAAAKWFSQEKGSLQLAAGFLGCALAAGLSLLAGAQALAFTAAVAVGSSLAWTTVVLVLCLRPTVHLKRLGICCGLGTGLAYAFCNQPPVFTATPRAQTIVAIFFALLGFAISFRLRSNPTKPSSSLDYRTLPIVLWLVLFLGLVWLDSAAFFIIQHSPYLKADTWDGVLALQGNAFVHLCAAVLAGLALDRRQQALTTGTALLVLLGACLLLGWSSYYFPLARVFYTAGVSIYSTALVFYPARSGRPWVAGLFFAVSGWFGSAAGIGMAQSLQAIPLLFIIVVAAVSPVVFLVRHYWLKHVRTNLTVLPLLVVGLFFCPHKTQAADTPEILLGREVYISEGCMHCHSQYVRPQTADAERWGPASALADSLAQQPPLFGNRRQGPDLVQVANRRTPEWNRLHLIAPRTLTPGSRMPSYAYLFKNNNPRGEALVAYLASLGAENFIARLQTAQTWQPVTGTSAASEREQRELFTELCASCHGSGAKGDGPLATKLSLRPPDFTRDPWRHVSSSDPTLAIARVIKFGQPGTVMAGHEYLTDREIMTLTAFVSRLHREASNL